MGKKKKDKGKLTLDGVGEQQARLSNLEQRGVALQVEERELTAQIAQCHASGDGDLKGLTQRRREVRELRADILESLPLVQEAIARDRAALCQAQAGQRMVGIARAFGSVRQEMDDAESRLKEKAGEFKEEVDRFNGYYQTLAGLKAESDALSHRFELEIPTFPPVVAPARRLASGQAVDLVSVRFLDTAYISPATERDETGLLRRRDYSEVADTPAGEIISAAGPRAWPPLTDMQKSIVAGREQDAQEERDFAERIGGEIAARKTLPAV